MEKDIKNIQKEFLKIGRAEEKKIAAGRLIEFLESDLLKWVRAVEPSVTTEKLRKAIKLAEEKGEIEIHCFPNDDNEESYRFYFKVPLNITGDIINNDWLTFRTIADDTILKFNKITGDFQLGGAIGTFAPGTQEYKILLCFLTSPQCVVKYATLLKTIYPNRDFAGQMKEYLIEKMVLSSAINKIKNGLGILPEKKSINKDIFQTMRADKKYRLTIKP